MRQNSLVLMVSYSSEAEKLYYVTLFNIMKLNEKEKKMKILPCCKKIARTSKKVQLRISKHSLILCENNAYTCITLSQAERF